MAVINGGRKGHRGHGVVGHSDRCRRRIQDLMQKDLQPRDIFQQAYERRARIIGEYIETTDKEDNTDNHRVALQLNRVVAPGSFMGGVPESFAGGRGVKRLGAKRWGPRARRGRARIERVRSLWSDPRPDRGRDRRRSCWCQWREDDNRCVVERRRDRHAHEGCV